ncbi:MAG: Hsp70 family protein [Prevotella sp.]|nr:Hsp70 family protein [Prevotella sp.]
MSAIGIDFGTSFCSASWVNPQTGRPEVITFHETGTAKIPSIVYFPDNGEPNVGQGPFMLLDNIGGLREDQRQMVLQATVQSIKRKMKRGGRFRTPQRDYSHTDIVALILKKIRTEAELSCVFPEPVTELVLTHPVMFEEWKKDLLQEAARQAGFQKVTLLEEPVSAAIGYIGANNQPDTKGVMVYDLGAGTFDVAYVQIEHNGKNTEYHIPVPPRGDSMCGGDDIDMVLYQEWEQLARSQYHRSLSPREGEIDLGFLFRCRKGKEMLSNMPQYMFNELLPPVPGSPLQRLQMNITRQEFNSKIDKVIDRTISKTKELLDDIRAKNLPLDYAILIGGSSRIPLVAERLQQTLGKVPVRTTGAVDAAVALGASYYRLEKEHVHRADTKAQTGKPANDNEECFCIYCGKKFRKSFRFCMFCGKPNYLLKK